MDATALAALIALPAGRDLPPVIPARPAWHAAAACRGHALADFFAAKGDPDQLDRRRRALDLCRACPVRRRCAAENLDELTGVFGGLSGRQRRLIRQGRLDLDTALDQ